MALRTGITVGAGAAAQELLSALVGAARGRHGRLPHGGAVHHRGAAMHPSPLLHRRSMLGAAAAGTLLLAACGAVRDEAEDPPVLPVEDLMREHALLARLLIVYEQALAQKEPPWPVIGNAARLIRTFIEEYHERQEEEDVFPRLEHAGREVALIRTLRQQHQAGRRLTARIEHVLAQPPASGEDRQAVTASIQGFLRMYRAHAAYEDTVLLPAFRALVSRRDYEALGEQFEQREHALFGKDGFAEVLHEVARLEAALGLDDVAVFTPAG
jgi:hemerythrin-like domain-containing protein